MGHAEAMMYGTGDTARIVVRTVKTRGVDDFDFMLSASKMVPGGVWDGDRKFWHYPLTTDTCLHLRRAFGGRLRVHEGLAFWYKAEVGKVAAHAKLSGEMDANLRNVPDQFSAWLRGYQRSGAAWIAEGFRGAGLVADHPGLGKTPETLAAMLEAGVRGPVLVVCPKKSVRVVWGYEARKHLKGVPVYACRGKRAARQRMLALFAKHMRADPHRLRIVVVVAEMLRVELGDPCYTTEWSDEQQKYVPKNKVNGMCPAKRRGEKCTRHVQVAGPQKTKAQKQKNLVPVGFSYPELFNPDLLHGGWAWQVLDESHRLLGSLTVTRGNLMGKGLRMIPEREGRRRYALSGSPFGKAGRAQGLFGTLHWLWPDEYRSFWKWAAESFEIQEDIIGWDRQLRQHRTAKKIIGVKGMPGNPTPEEESAAFERFLAKLGPRILRRTKEECIKDLPPKSYVNVPCELTAEQRRQWKELVEFAEVTTPGGPVAANGALALLTRAKQIALGEITKGPDGKVTFGEASGKLDRLWDALDTRGILDGEPGGKLIIASRYNEFLDVIAEYLRIDGVEHFQMDGRTSDNAADHMMQAWQSNQSGPRVFLVNTKAGGISINLDAADEMHMMDEDPDPGVNEQLEDRLHRASRMHKVIIFNYRTEGTHELAQAEDVEYRRRVQHAILDGRRGVDYVRRLLSDAQSAFMDDEEEVA